MGRLKNKKSTPSFSRPSVDLSRVKREWKYVQAQNVKKDDIVAGLGLVQSVLLQLPSSAGDDKHVMISAGVEGSTKIHFYEPSTDVFAFVRKE